MYPRLRCARNLSAALFRSGCTGHIARGVEGFLPGATFGRYRIEGIVGRGGMAVVYRATEVALSRQVALKVVLGGAPPPAC